jgi:hypothetical protein
MALSPLLAGTPTVTLLTAESVVPPLPWDPAAIAMRHVSTLSPRGQFFPAISSLTSGQTPLLTMCLGTLEE